MKTTIGYEELEWPSGCPGPGRSIPKKWDHDGLYRDQWLYALHCAMNADAIRAKQKELRAQLRAHQEERSRRGKAAYAKWLAQHTTAQGKGTHTCGKRKHTNKPNP